MGDPTIELGKQDTTEASRSWTAIVEKYQALLILAIPLILYVVLVSWEGYRLREGINPDAVSYIRNALYLSEGRFADSVSGYRSPLISWCTAPLLYLGLDGLYAMKIVLAVWGVGFVAASFALMRRLTPAPAWLQLVTLLLIAISAARAATWTVTPDLILFTVLLAYCSVAISSDLLERQRSLVLCGLLGGVAYLAKAYALPFFLVHFTFVVALQWWANRNRTSIRRAVLLWATGILAFAMVSVPWIGVLSWKYQRLMYSTCSPAARNLVGPEEIRVTQVGGMHHLPPGRIYAGEVRDLAPIHRSWLPFQSLAYAKHQVLLTLRHTKRILEDIRGFDFLGISLAALLFAPILLWKAESRNDWFKSIWILGTVSIYCLGYTMVFYEIRYMEHFLWPLCTIYCLVSLTPSLVVLGFKAGLPTWRGLLVGAVVLLSFAAQAFYRELPYLLDSTPPLGATYRRIAEELRAGGLEGPFATEESEPRRRVGAYIGMFLNVPFLGSPVVKSDEEIDTRAPVNMPVSEIEAKLDEYGARTFLLQSDSPLADRFRKETSWHLKQEVPYDDHTVFFVYVPASPNAAQQRQPSPAQTAR